MMHYTYFLFGLLISAFGILFALGKCHGHLAAWKQMTEAEKAAIRIVPLCRNVGGMILLCGILFLLGGVSPVFQAHAFLWAKVLWMIAAWMDVRWISKSGRYNN